MLWLKKNMPEEFDNSVINDAVMATGNEVGDLAMGLFGEYVEVPFGDLKEMIEKTKELIEANTPIIAEASFSVDGLFCSVDILKNLGDKTVELYEVKSSTHVCLGDVNGRKSMALLEQIRTIDRCRLLEQTATPSATEEMASTQDSPYQRTAPMPGGALNE